MNIDIRTLILLHFIVNLINVGAVTIIWQQYRMRFRGISLWLAYVVMQAGGLGLILLRGFIPDFLSIVIANSFLMIGNLCLFIGLEQFVNQRSSQVHNYGFLAIYVFLLYYYSAIQPNLTAREILVSIFYIIFDAQIIWLLVHRTPLVLRSMVHITSLVFMGHLLTSLSRIILIVLFPLRTNDFFQSRFNDALPITLYLALAISFVITLILMVSQRLLDEVQISEEKFTKAFHSAPYAILLTRPADGKILEANDGFMKITGYTHDEVLGKTTLDLNLWVDKEHRKDVMKKLSMDKKIQGIEYPFRIKSGEIITGLYSAETLLINKEELVLSSISDITELSKIRQRLQIEATHDHLTGLPNRKLFYDRFHIAKANAQRYQKGLAIISLDLDEFKTINDTFGHDVGDQVLVEVTRRLTTGLRKGDTVARFGGDEFVLLLTEIKSREDVIEVAQKILHNFQAAFHIDEHQFNLSASIGIALQPQDGKTINDLVKKSDQALYQVKKNGKSNYCFYDDIPEVEPPDFSEEYSE
jgi:diguanylate cyclase (GGDEF)-like protein/PAS domain S-box-containing protein